MFIILDCCHFINYRILDLDVMVVSHCFKSQSFIPPQIFLDFSFLLLMDSTLRSAKCKSYELGNHKVPKRKFSNRRMKRHCRYTVRERMIYHAGKNWSIIFRVISPVTWCKLMIDFDFKENRSR